MPYEIDNQGRTNEVHRVTSPVAPQRDPAAVPFARVEKIGGADRVTIRSNNSDPNEKPAPSNPTPVREGGVVERFNTYTGEYTATRPDQKPQESVYANVPRSSATGLPVDLNSLDPNSPIIINGREETVLGFEAEGVLVRSADGRLSMKQPTDAATNTSATNTTKLPASSGEPEQVEQVPLPESEMRTLGDLNKTLGGAGVLALMNLTATGDATAQIEEAASRMGLEPSELRARVNALGSTLAGQAMQALGMDKRAYAAMTEWANRLHPGHAAEARRQAVEYGRFDKNARALRDAWLNDSKAQAARWSDAALATIPGSFVQDGVVMLNYRGRRAPVRDLIADGALRVTPNK